MKKISATTLTVSRSLFLWLSKRTLQHLPTQYYERHARKIDWLVTWCILYTFLFPWNHLFSVSRVRLKNNTDANETSKHCHIVQRTSLIKQLVWGTKVLQVDVDWPEWTVWEKMCSHNIIMIRDVRWHPGFEVRVPSRWTAPLASLKVTVPSRDPTYSECPLFVKG